MRKLISLLLALVMIMSFATVAFATEDTTTVDLKKVYKVANATDKNPAETFTFKIEKESVAEAGLNAKCEVITKDNMPMFEKDTVTISFNEGEATVAGDTNSATLTLPTYDAVGIYTYKITEQASNTAGLTIDSNILYLKVTVIQEAGKVRVAALRYSDATTGSKEQNLTNTYAAGGLDVTKTVAGALGDQEQPFSFKVTFTAPSGKTVKSTIGYTLNSIAQTAPTFDANGTCTVNFTLAHGDTASFTNLPVGVTYTVEETAFDGYTTTKTGDSGAIESGKTATAAFTNTKEGAPDTGITLDSIPFVVMMVVCAAAAVLFVIKRRSVEF